MKVLNKIDITGLEAIVFEKMNTIFSKYHEIESVELYGSRAMGNYKTASDIDLTLKGTIDLSLQFKIEFDLDDLMFPYKFDISIYNKISNQEFLEHIKRVGIVIYKKEKYKL